VSDKRLHRGPALPSQICRQSRRERDRERERAGGPGRGVHYLDDRRLSTAGLQDIIDGRPTLIDVTPSCIDRIDGRRAASNN
jgi:hypothetical protein